MVEPVPVNKYAENAVSRTLPGIVVALLWDLARDPSFNCPIQKRQFEETKEPAHLVEYLCGIRIGRSPCGANSSDVSIASCFSSPSSLEDRIVQAATDRWLQVEKNQMEMWNSDRSTDLFRESAMTSLRDIDVSVQFGGLHDATRIYEALFGHDVD